ncbi:MAG: recombinase family protein [Propionibacteriales bacterium]|nr:recombinase family protein [Propionibacteriales bacterium]
MTKNVGIYARISDDPSGTKAGVTRQIEDCTTICTLRGWTPIVEYVDNDVSAYKPGVVRPAFERMLVDLDRGVIEGIVVYDLDRLMRQPIDLERAIEIYEARMGLVFASAQGDVDLAGDGQTMARVMAAFANKASADTARRVKRKHLDLAEKGIPVGGTRPFGWQKDKLTLHADEAAIARAGIDRVLAGLSPRVLAQEWNADGIRTTRGKNWTGKTVRQYLLNPRLAGYRDYKGQPQFDAAGARVTGTWEPLVSVDMFERLQEALVREERRTRIPRKGALQYLLSGVARCGICGAVMYGNSRGSESGLWYYVCSEANGHNLSASGPAVDSLVEEVVLGRLLNVGSIPVDAPEWNGRARQAEAAALINETMEAYRSGGLDKSIAFPTVTALKDELNALDKDHQAWLHAHCGPSNVDLTRDDWDALHRDERRAIIQTFFSAIVVREATRKSNRFDPARVEPVPRAAA